MKARYDVNDLGYGIEIFPPFGDDTVFLQGDDANQLREELEELESVWIENDFLPIGPFETYEDNQDAILDVYFA